MRNFLRLLSVFSVLIALLSCKSFQITDAAAQTLTKKSVENLYFSERSTDYLYKARIEVYRNEISGILIIKKTSENTHRVVMTTDFGNKMMDLEISGDSAKFNYVVPNLDREMIKKVLEKDFKVLLKEQYLVSEQFQNGYFDVYKSETERQHFYLYFDRKNSLLTKIIATESGKEKINFNFVPKTSIFAANIELIHKDIKLKIILNQITEQL